MDPPPPFAWSKQRNVPKPCRSERPLPTMRQTKAQTNGAPEQIWGPLSQEAAAGGALQQAKGTGCLLIRRHGGPSLFTCTRCSFNGIRGPLQKKRGPPYKQEADVRGPHQMEGGAPTGGRDDSQKTEGPPEAPKSPGFSEAPPTLTVDCARESSSNRSNGSSRSSISSNSISRKREAGGAAPP
ncbi:hypothetical protein ACSSS7_008001 [Eimeria intestinalis]